MHPDSRQDTCALHEVLLIGEAAVWWDMFRQLTVDCRQYIADIVFVDGYIWQDTTGGGSFWYAQPELTDGKPVKVSYPLGDGVEQGFLEQSFNAFTHFVHSETTGMEVLMDFQGFKSGTRFTVFDCK
ncbi:hypothetical protein K439DRAFT_1623211 [Ramaria rubella]|nr:hypothetical protein K439DRAFT_1623211 [Ramaria rubella]